MSKKKVYISGKITGIEDVAPQLFAEAEELITQAGFEAVNPMTIPHDHDLSWGSYMRADIKAMLDCDYVFTLDNWSHSKGAFIEVVLAKHLEMSIMTKQDLLMKIQNTK